MKKLISLCALFAFTTIMALAADVTGNWSAPAGEKGPGPSFKLKQSGSLLTGTTTMRNAEIAIANGKVDGDKVYFEVTREMGGNSVTVKYSGTVSGGTMKLSYDMGRGPRDITLTKQ